MVLNYLALLGALLLAGCAAYFSIVGLTAIFHGAFISVIVMASVMEYAKLISAAYLHIYWEQIGIMIKSYLLIAVAVLMLITSMGIFGFLSKAHIEQNAPVANNSLKIERLEQQISREQKKITDAESVIAQLDGALETLIEYDKISGDDGYRAVRDQQQDQRDIMSETIDTAQAKIDELEESKLTLNQQLTAIELEVGPLKYIAALIYDNPKDKLEETVRLLVLLLVFVFDPLAVVLLITAVKMIREEPRKVKTTEVAVIDDAFEETTPPQESAPKTQYKGRRISKPNWVKNATATTRGWVDDKGTLLKAMKLSKNEVDELNKEK